jgi:hypothetical protein
MPKVATRLAGFVIALAVAGTLLATDVWRVKDYKQWDAKDVDKILNDSPWVKSVPIARFWATPAPIPGADTARPSVAGQPPPSSQMGTMAKPAAAPDSAGSAPADTFGAQSNFIVRWTSALTVHRAVARIAELRNPASTADAEKYLSAAPETYDVAVIGDMTPFGALSTPDAVAQLQQRTSLALKESGQHFTPVKVDLSRAPDQRTLQSITFHFAKKTADGTPIFPSDAIGVDFVCKSGKLEIKAHFDFTKMIGAQGLDL